MKCEGCGTIESGSYRYYERKWFCLSCYWRYKSGDTRYIPSGDSAFLKMTEQAVSNDEAVIKGSRNVRPLIRPIPMGETVPEVSNISASGSKVADPETEIAAFVTKDWVERLPAQTLEDARKTRWDPCSCGSGKEYGKCCKKVSAIERLINILSYGNSEDKAKAVIALGDTQDGRAVKPLILALGTYDSSISKEAFYALQYIGKTATKSLIRAIKDKDVNIRIQIIRILGNIGDNRALIPLIRLLEDRDENVRIEAAKALGNLSWRPVTIIEKVYFLVAKHDWETIRFLGARAIEPLIGILGRFNGKDFEGLTTLEGLEQSLLRIYSGITTIIFGFGEMSSPLRREASLHDFDFSSSTMVLNNLNKVIINTETYNFHQVESFITYAVNYIGKKHLKKNVEVHLYGDPEKLHHNLKNLFDDLFKTLEFH